MTIVIYNGVQLLDCETKSFEQTIEMDPSGTDLMFSRFKVRVAATLVPTEDPKESFGINPPPIGGTVPGSVPDRLQAVHALLSQPRKDFWMIIPNAVAHNTASPPECSDRTVLMAAGSTDSAIPINPRNPGHQAGFIDRLSVIDVDNGPKPKHVSVKEITGGRSMRVEFEIEVCRRICTASDGGDMPNFSDYGEMFSTTNEVLTNRWTLDESKDENWVTTRKLRGELRVVHHDVWPHFMRYLCVPPLLLGFRRVGQHFTDDPTGLVLQYEIADRQEHAAPPYPAIAWSGHHGETTTNNGSIQVADFAIRLVGPPGVNKVQLIQAARKVAIDRIRGLVPEFKTVNGKPVQVDAQTKINNMVVVSHISEPTIELRCSVSFFGELGQPKVFNTRVEAMGRPMDSMRLVRPSPFGGSGSHPSAPAASQLSEPGPEFKVAGYNSRVWPVPLLYSSETPAGIFACYLQNPCSEWHGVPGGQSGRPIVRPITEERPETEHSEAYPDQHPAVVASSPHALPVDQTIVKWFEGGVEPAFLHDLLKFTSYPYQFVEIETTYKVSTGWSQLPLARTGGAIVWTPPTPTPPNPTPPEGGGEGGEGEPGDEDGDGDGDGNNGGGGVVLPVSTDTCKLIQLHGGAAKRIIRVTATRDGFMPMIPRLVDRLTDPNGVREALLDCQVVFKAPEITSSGSNRRYAAEVIAEYAMSRPPAYTDLIRGMFLPYDMLEPMDNWIRWNDIQDPANFVQTYGNYWS